MVQTGPTASAALARRAGIGLVILCYMGLALGSGIDRLSATRPGLAQHVPALFASEALRVRGGEALGQGGALAARKIGELALRDAPTDPQSAALFAAGNLANGNPKMADRAFRVAGQLGWRVPITQTYWMSKALANSDYAVAALRLDALLRQQPSLLAERQLIDPFERNPAGRAALIARIALRPPWLHTYTVEIGAVPRDAVLQRMTVLSEAAQSGVVLGCNDTGPVIDRLYDEGMPGEAAALWKSHCPAAGAGLVNDPGFLLADLNERRSVLSWQIIGNSSLAVGLAAAPDGRSQRLSISGSPERPTLFLRQVTVLAPGRYQVRWQGGQAEGQSSPQVLAAISCRGETPVWVTPQPDPVAGYWRAAVVVDAKCKLPELGFAAAPGLTSAWLQHVTLTSLP